MVTSKSIRHRSTSNNGISIRKNNGLCGVTVGVIGISLGLFGSPAIAQNTLERMQDDVASIVERAKGAVVSIEDARGVVLHYDKTTLNKQNLEEKRKLLSVEAKLTEAELDTVTLKYQQGAASYTDLLTARTDASRTKLELAIAERKLKQAGNVSEQETALTELNDQVRRVQIELDAETSQFSQDERKYKAGALSSAEMEASRARLAKLTAALAEAKELLAEARLAQAQSAIQKQNSNPKTAEPFNPLKWQSGSQLSYLTSIFFANSSPKSGTGFSIGDGYILTTADVLEGMQNPIITTDTGLRIQGRVLGIDSELNVGLIVLEAKVKLPALTLGSSATAVAGHFAISIGNQSGQHNSVALAMVAGVRGEGTYSGSHFYPVLLQLAGTIGAGSSGSPVLDARGEVIGILAAAQADEASAYVTTNAGAANLTKIITGLKYAPSALNGQSDAPMLSKVPIIGDLFQNAPKANPTRDAKPKHYVKGKPSSPKTKSVPDALKSDGTTGDVPPHITPGTRPLQITILSPANADLLQQNPNWQGVTATLAKPDVSDNLRYAFNAGGIAQRSAVTSAGFAIAVDQIKSVIETLKAGKPIAHNWLGVGLDNKEDAKETDGIVKVDRTVQINSVYSGSPADRAGIRQGDVLVSIDSRSVHSSEEVRALVLQLREGAQVPVVFVRKGETRTGTLLITSRPEKLPGLLTPAR